MRLIQADLVAVIIAVCISTFPIQVSAIRVDSRSCSKTERTQILNAVRWLKSQNKTFKNRLGTDGLAQFKGRSEQRWKRILNSSGVIIRCDRGRACDGDLHRIPFGERSLPVRHTVPIKLCTSHLDETGHYAVVLAHELGHLVWINADRKDCVKRCNQPRLSQSLALMAYHLWTGIAYDRMACLNACTPGGLPSENPADIDLPTTPGMMPTFKFDPIDAPPKVAPPSVE